MRWRKTRQRLPTRGPLHLHSYQSLGLRTRLPQRRHRAQCFRIHPRNQKRFASVILFPQLPDLYFRYAVCHHPDSIVPAQQCQPGVSRVLCKRDSTSRSWHIRHPQELTRPDTSCNLNEPHCFRVPVALGRAASSALPASFHRVNLVSCRLAGFFPALARAAWPGFQGLYLKPWN